MAQVPTLRPVGYIAATVPAKVERVTHTTLFHVAELDFGNALWWTAIANLNGMVDPWITNGQVDLKIPPTLPSTTPSGILGQ